MDLILEVKGDYKKQLIMINPGFSMNIWSEKESSGKNWFYVEEFFEALYMNMVNMNLEFLKNVFFV